MRGPDCVVWRCSHIALSGNEITLQQRFSFWQMVVMGFLRSERRRWRWKNPPPFRPSGAGALPAFARHNLGFGCLDERPHLTLALSAPGGGEESVRVFPVNPPIGNRCCLCPHRGGRLANQAPRITGPKLAQASDMNCPVPALPAQAPLPTANVAGSPAPAAPVAGPFDKALAQLLAALPRPVSAGTGLGAAALADTPAVSSLAIAANTGKAAISPAVPPAAGQAVQPASDTRIPNASAQPAISADALALPPAPPPQAEPDAPETITALPPIAAEVAALPRDPPPAAGKAERPARSRHASTSDRDTAPDASALIAAVEVPAMAADPGIASPPAGTTTAHAAPPPDGGTAPPRVAAGGAHNGGPLQIQPDAAPDKPAVQGPDKPGSDSQAPDTALPTSPSLALPPRPEPVATLRNGAPHGEAPSDPADSGPTSADMRLQAAQRAMKILTPPSAAPPKHDAAPAPVSPAEQIAPALVSLARSPQGRQQLTVRLEPAELGHVEVRVERQPDAPVRVDITVQRPETLTLLLRDQPQLQRALDQAGLPADGRSVVFHVSPPSPVSADAGNSNGLATSSGNNWGGGSHGGFTGQHSGQPARGADAEEDVATAAAPPLARWLRAGIDITA